jgi:hypothetical protein
MPLGPRTDLAAGNVPQGAASSAGAQQPAIPALPAQPGAATGGAVTVAGQGGGGGQAATGEPVILQPPPYRSDIPPEVIPLVGMSLGIIMTMVILFPIARAIGKWIERRTDRSLMKVADVAPQIRQLQESLDVMAVELERISEAQRFQAKLMAERAGVLPGEKARG